MSLIIPYPMVRRPPKFKKNKAVLCELRGHKVNGEKDEVWVCIESPTLVSYYPYCKYCGTRIPSSPNHSPRVPTG